MRIEKTTICGTDLHILKGDVPTVTDGRILGHEGVGVVEEVGAGVSNFKKGDRVLISCITSCGKCDACKKGMYSHCADGGWILGHLIDGTQAEYVRIPHADNSLHHVPKGADEDALVMLSDILPTGFEVGVLNGKVKPGDTVAIVGGGPIGLAALLTAQFYSPAELIMIDLDDNRLEVAKKLGATRCVNSGDGKAVGEGHGAHGGQGRGRRHRGGRHPGDVRASARTSSPPVDTSPTSACTASPSPSSWRSSGSTTSRSRRGSSTPYTTPMLLKTVVAGRLQPRQLITHEFKLDDLMKAYDTFANAAKEKALKVIIRRG